MAIKILRLDTKLKMLKAQKINGLQDSQKILRQIRKIFCNFRL